MIEIVFGDSACGSLKQAQHYGEGEYLGGAFGVIVSRHDDSKPTEEEVQAARREYEERERLEWANATPMRGNPVDVYGFSFGLSIGDISEDIPDEKRRQTLEWLYSVYPNFDKGPTFTDKLMQHGKDILNEICNRISLGEEIRIWYSNQPDELCGLYWFVTQINQLNLQNGQVLLVSLPDWEITENGNIITQSGWGGVKPGDWHKYLNLQAVASPTFFNMCVTQWKYLQQENAPLRAVLNGRLVSIPETIYDYFIVREIEAEEDEFHEAMVIGKVLGKYALGIGDAWIAHRIEKMIADGQLTPVTEAAPGSPIYHRRLKKL